MVEAPIPRIKKEPITSTEYTSVGYIPVNLGEYELLPAETLFNKYPHLLAYDLEVADDYSDESLSLNKILEDDEEIAKAVDQLPGKLDLLHLGKFWQSLLGSYIQIPSNEQAFLNRLPAIFDLDSINENAGKLLSSFITDSQRAKAILLRLPGQIDFATISSGSLSFLATIANINQGEFKKEILAKFPEKLEPSQFSLQLANTLLFSLMRSQETRQLLVDKLPANIDVNTLTEGGYVFLQTVLDNDLEAVKSKLTATIGFAQLSEAGAKLLISVYKRDVAQVPDVTYSGDFDKLTDGAKLLFDTLAKLKKLTITNERFIANLDFNKLTTNGYLLVKTWLSDQNTQDKNRALVALLPEQIDVNLSFVSRAHPLLSDLVATKNPEIIKSILAKISPNLDVSKLTQDGYSFLYSLLKLHPDAAGEIISKLPSKLDLRVVNKNGAYLLIELIKNYQYQFVFTDAQLQTKPEELSAGALELITYLVEFTNLSPPAKVYIENVEAYLVAANDAEALFDDDISQHTGGERERQIKAKVRYTSAIEVKKSNMQRVFLDAIEKFKPEVIGEVRASISKLANEIIRMYEETDGKTIVFVTGGKSRSLTEVFLKKLIDSLPKDHPAVQALQQRVRLSDIENKNLYGEPTSNQYFKRRADGSLLLNKKSDLDPANTTFVFIDDFMNSGKKAFKLIQSLSELDADARFLAFTGNKPSENDDTDVTEDRPTGWQDNVSLVKVGTDDQDALQLVRALSNLVSQYVDVRLNGRIKTSTAYFSTRNGISPDPDLLKSYRNGYKLMINLKNQL